MLHESPSRVRRLPLHRRGFWVGLLAVWSLVVWGPRIRNIWTDEALTVGGQLLRTLSAAVFVAGALGVAWLWVRRHDRRRPVAIGFAIWTIGFWVVRFLGIARGGHSVGFVLVHAVLASVSVGLASVVLLAVRREG